MKKHRKLLSTLLAYIKIALTYSKRLWTVVTQSPLFKYIMLQLSDLAMHPYFLRTLVAFGLLIMMIGLHRKIEGIDNRRERRERIQCLRKFEKMHMLHRNQVKAYNLNSFNECTDP